MSPNSILKNLTCLIAIFFCFFTLYGCQPEYKEVISKESSMFSFKLEVSKNIKHSDRRLSLSENEIILDNTLFEQALSVLLEKDTSLISFQNEEGMDLMLKAVYNNYRENTTIKESKAEFLKQLKEHLDFSLAEEIPEKTYQLTIYDSLLLEKNISKEQKQDQSMVFNSSSRNETRFTNASISQITEGFNKTYNSNIVSGDNMNDFTKYSFEVEEIPFEDLKIYLEKNIGLSLVSYNESGFEADFQTATTVVFND